MNYYVVLLDVKFHTARIKFYHNLFSDLDLEHPDRSRFFDLNGFTLTIVPGHQNKIYFLEYYWPCWRIDSWYSWHCQHFRKIYRSCLLWKNFTTKIYWNRKSLKDFLIISMTFYGLYDLSLTFEIAAEQGWGLWK